MREALLRKRYGIPAALLLVLLLSGTVFACYAFTTISSTTRVREPMSTANNAGFSATMDPGETNTWSFDIVNSADVAYMIKADLTFDAPSEVSITSYTITGDTAGGQNWYDADDSGDLTDGDSISFLIKANGTVTCTINIYATNAAAPGDVTATFILSRA